jgi:hypothetical protein
MLGANPCGSGAHRSRISDNRRGKSAGEPAHAPVRPRGGFSVRRLSARSPRPLSARFRRRRISGCTGLAGARSRPVAGRTARRAGLERRDHGDRVARDGGRGQQPDSPDLDPPPGFRSGASGRQLHPDGCGTRLSFRRGGDPGRGRGDRHPPARRYPCRRCGGLFTPDGSR